MLDLNPALSMRRRRGVIAFLLFALAALALVLISEGAYRRASASMDGLGTIAQARSSMQELHRHMLDAETGQRGYLITGRKEYLAPYREANEEIQNTLKRLHAYFDTAPAGARSLGELETLAQRKMSELDTTLRLHDEGRDEAWRSLMSSDIGREQMDAFRALSQQMLADETRKAAEGREDVYRTLRLSRIGIAAMTALGLLALFMYQRQTGVLEALRDAQQLAIQAERDRLEQEALQRTAQLRELAQHLQTAREDERSRLARDLHDELGALLTTAKLDAARLRSRIAHAGPEALERLAHLGETLNSGIALKRRIIEDLRPSALSNLGLVPALDILTREHAQHTGVAVHAAFDDVHLADAAALTVYRLVQEALTNASNYARATRIDVHLGSGADGVRISVADDGVGFDPATASSSHGLFGMRYRVEALGGRLDIRSAPGHGTCIEARLPEVPAAARPAVKRD